MCLSDFVTQIRGTSCMQYHLAQNQVPLPKTKIPLHTQTFFAIFFFLFATFNGLIIYQTLSFMVTCCHGFHSLIIISLVIVLFYLFFITIVFKITNAVTDGTVFRLTYRQLFLQSKRSPLLPRVEGKGCDKKYDYGEIRAVDPNLKILYNRVLIADKENLFTYVGWLGISGVISQNPPNFDCDRSIFNS